MLLNFFSGINIQENGVFIKKSVLGRASGEGYVEFVDNANAQAALSKNRDKMDHRYIEIFKSTEADRDKAANISVPIFDISNSTVDQNSTVIRMRGLPWSTTEKDVKDFFSPTEVSVVHIIPDHMQRASGDGFVEFATAEDGVEAMKKQRGDMGGRYIELFNSTPQELSCVLARLNPSVSDDSFLCKMRGLPYSTTEDEVNQFFGHPSELIKVHFIQDMNGRSTGEAFAEFNSEEAVLTALKKNKEHIGERYVELFKATPAELKATLRRPSNYGRRFRFRGGRNQNRGGGGGGGGSKMTPLTKQSLDAEMDAYQKKRKVQ